MTMYKTMAQEIKEIKYYDETKGGIYSKAEWKDNGGGNYVNVYFRIDTVGFDCMSGYFQNDDDRNAFISESSKLVKSFNIDESCGYKTKDEYLYCHPQNISGIVAKNKVKDIAKAINESCTMKIRWVDVYKTYYKISDEDYSKILETKKEEMARAVLESCVTKRKNSFVRSYEVAVRIAEKFKTYRINAQEDINNLGMTFRYVDSIINKLIEKRYLKSVEQNGNLYIRTINKTEQKKEKINLENQLTF